VRGGVRAGDAEQRGFVVGAVGLHFREELGGAHISCGGLREIIGGDGWRGGELLASFLHEIECVLRFRPGPKHVAIGAGDFSTSVTNFVRRYEFAAYGFLQRILRGGFALFQHRAEFRDTVVHLPRVERTCFGF